MFSLKNKLEPNLKYAIETKLYKNYRVIIHCKNLSDKIAKRVDSSNGLIRDIPSIGCISALLSSQMIERLLEYPQIDYICFDNYALLCGSSVMAANGIRYQTKYRLTGKDITIGIIDSGVYPHPDLINPDNKIKKFVDLLNSINYPYDDNGHGTFISGIICGSGYCSKGMYRGIAENSRIYMIKAFNQTGKGYISDILFSLDTMIEQAEENNIKVICLPFEILNNDYLILSLFSSLFEKAANKNIIIVVPSGNNGNIESTIRGIAILNNCITVGGINTKGSTPKPSIISSSGPAGKSDKPELSAACEDICSTRADIDFVSEKNGRRVYPSHLDSPYTNFTGTSCAAAFVSALCALLFENNPKLTLKDITSLLTISCNLHEFSKWYQGAGSVDIHKLFP